MAQSPTIPESCEAPLSKRLRILVRKTVSKILRRRSDEDFDGKPVHVSEIGKDGCLYVAMGPHFYDPGIACFHFVRATPDGLHVHKQAAFDSRSLAGSGRERRIEIIQRMLVSSMTMWERDMPLDARFLTRRKVETRTRPSEDLKTGFLRPCGHHVPELEAYLTEAMRNPAGLMHVLKEARSGEFERIRVRLNELLTVSSHGHLAKRGLKNHPWLPYCCLEAVSSDNISKARILEMDESGVARLLTTCLDHPRWVVSPWIVRWMDKRAATNPMPIPDARTLVVLDAIPRSWLPRDRSEMLYFQHLFKMILPLFNDVDQTVSLLGSSKGRFGDLVRRMQTDLGGRRDLGGAIRDISDMLQAVCKDLLDVPGYLALGPSRGEVHFEPLVHVIVAARLLTPDGGIRRLLALSERWHMLVLQQAPPKPVEIRSSWPRSVADMTTSNGCSVVELLDKVALDREGRLQGHCVGTYDAKCTWGGSHVFSIRSGTGTLSTFEVEFDVENDPVVPIVRQHQAKDRAKPNSDAEKALAEWLRCLKDGRTSAAPRMMDREKMLAASHRPTRTPMTLDQWRPFLAGPMGDLPEHAFRQEAMGMLQAEKRKQNR